MINEILIILGFHIQVFKRSAGDSVYHYHFFYFAFATFLHLLIEELPDIVKIIFHIKIALFIMLSVNNLTLYFMLCVTPLFDI